MDVELTTDNEEFEYTQFYEKKRFDDLVKGNAWSQRQILETPCQQMHQNRLGILRQHTFNEMKKIRNFLKTSGRGDLSKKFLTPVSEVFEHVQYQAIS